MDAYAAGAVAVGGAAVALLLARGRGTPAPETFESHVGKHEEHLRELVAGRLWEITSDTPHVDLPRNMLIYRLPDRRLLLHSVVALREETMREIEALGRVSWIVVPNSFHRIDLKVYHARYPDALVVSPQNALKAVGSHVPGVKAMETEPSLHEAGIGTLSLAGAIECPLALPVGDGRHALAVCDTFFHLPSDYGGWFTQKVMGSVGFFGVGPLGRLMLRMFGKGLVAFGKDLEVAADAHNWVAITMAHGHAVLGDDCAEKLKRIAQSETLAIEF